MPFFRYSRLISLFYLVQKLCITPFTRIGWPAERPGNWEVRHHSGGWFLMLDNKKNISGLWNLMFQRIKFLSSYESLGNYKYLPNIWETRLHWASINCVGSSTIRTGILPIKDFSHILLQTQTFSLCLASRSW